MGPGTLWLNDETDEPISCVRFEYRKTIFGFCVSSGQLRHNLISFLTLRAPSSVNGRSLQSKRFSVEARFKTHPPRPQRPEAEVACDLGALGPIRARWGLNGESFSPGFLLPSQSFVCPVLIVGWEHPQVPVQATVSSEPVKMEANGHPEGIIHLDVAATDRDGKPFPGLAAKDFTLTDHGAPQKILSFPGAFNEPTNENERLTEVVLVLDEVDRFPRSWNLRRTNR